MYAQGGPALVPQIVRALDAAHAEVARLTLAGPSLDDVFLKHTGHTMRVEEVRRPSRMLMGRGRRRRR